MNLLNSALTLALITASAFSSNAAINKAQLTGRKHAPLNETTVHKASAMVPDHTAYAWVTRDRGSIPLGLVSFSLTRPDLLTSRFQFSNKAFAGAMADGKYLFYRYKDDTTNQELVPIALSSVDIQTGKITDIADWSDQDFILNDMTYDYSTGTLYGLGRSVYIDDFLTALQFEYSALYTINPTTGVATQVKQFIDWSTATMGNTTYLTLAADLQGNLYSIDANGYLVMFDKDDDYSEIVIGYTGLAPHTYLQCMEFDHTTESLYWAADYYSQLSNFAVVNTDNGKATVIGDLGTDSRLAGLYIPFDVPSTGAPAAVSNFSLTADASGANSATLAWKNPTTTYGNSSLSSISKIEVTRGDDVIAELTGAPGENMTYTDLRNEAGAATYAVAAYNVLGKGLAHAATTWIGHDVPAAVGNLGAGRTDSGAAYLEWEAPATGLHEGWIDRATLSYNIRRFPDNVEVATNVKGTSFTDGTIATIGKYYYTVTPTTADGEGPTSTSVEIAIGNAIASFPWNCVFDGETVFDAWTVVNNNGGSTWSLKNRGLTDYTYFAMYSYDNKLDADDYLISPDLYLSKGATYTLKFNYRGSNTTYTETFDVTFGQGKTAEAQSTILKSYTVTTGDGAFDTLTLPTIEADGVYNFAFHATSDKGQYNIYITDVTVSQKTSGDSSITLDDASNLTAAVDNESGSVTLSWTKAANQNSDNDFTNETGSGNGDNNGDNSGSDNNNGTGDNAGNTDDNNNGNNNGTGGDDDDDDNSTPISTNISESFEDIAPNTINPAGSFGWSYIDNDGGIPYVDDYTGESPTGGQPLAAIVINPEEYSSVTYADNPPYDGDQYLTFMSNFRGGAPDDYFISPKLGFSRDFVFRFYCKADPDSGNGDDDFWGDRWNTEKFRVGYSTTGKKITDFIWTSSDPLSVTTEADEWVKKEFSIPAEAKYVCINYMTPDSGFWFMVDDLFIGIPETADNAPAKIAKASSDNFMYYEVYIDNKKVAETTANSYTATGLTDGLHSAKVVSVYAEGASRGISTTFAVNCSSAINTIAADAAANSNATFYSISGVKVDNNHLTPGLYIKVVNGKASRVAIK